MLFSSFIIRFLYTVKTDLRCSILLLRWSLSWRWHLSPLVSTHLLYVKRVVKAGICGILHVSDLERFSEQRVYSVRRNFKSISLWQEIFIKLTVKKQSFRLKFIIRSLLLGGTFVMKRCQHLMQITVRVFLPESIWPHSIQVLSLTEM